MRKLYFHMFMTLMLAFIVLVPFPALAMLTVKANHDHIEIDYNYHGSTVSVKGVSDPDTDIIIKINSEDKEQKLMRKDKRMGLLWMNVEALHFSQVPDVYLLKSTRPLDQIINRDQELSHAVGFDALAELAIIEPDRGADQKHEWFGQFVEFMKSKHLFNESSGDIDIAANKEGQRYSTVFDWPFEASPGKYEVEVLEVRDGAVIESVHSTIEVAKAGAVKMLSNMAMSKATLYGILSILIALAAGFGVGAVFGKGGGAH